MGEITGRQVFAVTAGAFGVIIAVNVLMAYKAVSTFPGLEVANSYVASQNFDARRAAQEGLGWSLAHEYIAASGKLVLDLRDADGLPAHLSGLKVLLGRTTEASADQTPEFLPVAGRWEASVRLERGKWLLKIEAFAEDGTRFEQRVDFYVKG